MAGKRNGPVKTGAAVRPGPNNTGAEQSLLGSLLLKREVYEDVCGIVAAADFYEPRHILIYEVITELYLQNRAVDSNTVTERLSSKGMLELAGGASYISSLADNVPSYAHAADYAGIVSNKAVLRRLIEMASGVAADSYSEGAAAAAIIKSADDALFCASRMEKIRAFDEVSERVGFVFEAITQRAKNPDLLDGLPTGFKKLDECMTGLKAGQLIVIAARPGLGKTSLAIGVACSLAVKHRRSALIFSFEMSSNDLIQRMLAVGSRVPLGRIRRGRVDPADKANLMHAADELSETDVFIDTADNNVFEIRAKTRAKMAELKKSGKTLDLVIVDYMQLVRPNESVPREQQISQISRGFKTLAMELKVPVIALSQLNREVEKREKSGDKNSPPRLSDLRESGAIEQDADIVIFIHREERELISTTETFDGGEMFTRKMAKCKLIIAKNRNGPVDEQGVWFIPELTLFQERTEQEEG